MATLPDLLALTSIADGGAVNAAPLRNDFESVQTAVNALIAALAGGSAGSILEATDANDVDWNGGVYTAYTPTWTASGTAPAIGNATVIARYARLGKLVHAYGQITFGSTSTFGTGTHAWALPVTAHISSTPSPIGNVYSFDTSAGNWAMGFAMSTGAGFNAQQPFTWPVGVQQVFAQTIPWTWAVGDQFGWNLTYEAA